MSDTTRQSNEKELPDIFKIVCEVYLFFNSLMFLETFQVFSGEVCCLFCSLF